MPIRTRRLMFVVPAHGRIDLAAICLRQLRRTCKALADHRIHASAIVIACDENLQTARDLGFGTIRRDNRFLSRRFNDGIQLACDPAFNPNPAEFVVPCGSDDWVDWRILLDLPAPGEIRAFKRAAFVKEDGTQIVSREVGYTGGVGIRIYPAHMMKLCGYRPADEDRKRACDTSILTRVVAAYRLEHRCEPRIRYADHGPFQIVDWKTTGNQLNSFDALYSHRINKVVDKPFKALEGLYPTVALREMRALYSNRRIAVAA